MANLALVKSKVQDILAANFSTELTDRGGFTLRYESARMFVDLRQNPEKPDGPVYISLSCPILFKVEPSAALNEYVAYHADDFTFGHLSLFKSDDGSATVYFTHDILGDFLDEEELNRSVVGVLGTANDLDDELQQKFGGRRFHED